MSLCLGGRLCSSGMGMTGVGRPNLVSIGLSAVCFIFYYFSEWRGGLGTFFT